jgi:hypothetical protein
MRYQWLRKISPRTHGRFRFTTAHDRGKPQWGRRKRPETEVHAGVLVTDNVFTDKSNVDLTLEQAEATIAQTADLRKEFLLKVLRTKGILKDETIPEVIQEEELGRSGTSDR